MACGRLVNFSVVIGTMLLCNNCFVRALTMDQLRNTVKTFRNSCITQSGVNPALLDGMDKGEFPEEESLQCYIKCVMMALKSMKDGKPVLSNLVKQIKLGLPKEMQENAAKASKYCCENVEYSDDACIAAWQFLKCTYVENPNQFFFP